MPITIECNFCRRRVKNRLQIPLCASVRRARGFAPLLVRLRTLRFAKLRLIRAVRSFAQDDTRGDGAPDDTRGMRIFGYSLDKPLALEYNAKQRNMLFGRRFDMKKVFKMEDLDCAHCAAKMEEGIKKIEGVTYASVSFMAQRLTVEADEEKFEEIIPQIVKAVKKVDSDCKVIIK